MMIKSLLKFLTVVFLLGFAGRYVWNHNSVPKLPFFEEKLKDEAGKSHAAADWKGKYILVSYFQSWCGDCGRELPSVISLQQNIGKDKLEVVLISDEPFEKINKFKNHFKADFVFYQSEKKLKNIGINVFPTTYLLDPKGNIIASKLEGFDWNSDEIKKLMN